MAFQSTLPVWGATSRKTAAEMAAEFQSTLPVWGATVGDQLKLKQEGYFNPRSPCGERHVDQCSFGFDIVISIHAPRVGSDNQSLNKRARGTDFNPRSPCGERLPHKHRQTDEI